MQGIALYLVAVTLIAVIMPSALPILLVFTALVVVVTCVQVPLSMRALNRVRDQLGHVAGTFEEDFTARHEIRKFAAVDKQTRRFRKTSCALRQARRLSTSIENVYAELLGWCAQVFAVLILIRGGNLVLAGTISIGGALVVRLLAQQATLPLLFVGQSWGEFLAVRVSWRRLQQPFAVEILPPEQPDAPSCPSLRGEISFEDVAFSYPHTGRSVLSGVTFRIPAGAAVAVVGYTGAGKSSIAKLLMRAYDPEHGTVRVDGHDLRDLDLTSYRRRLGIVPQDAFLFRGTVASNIAYGRPDASRADIEAAAVAVGAHDVLSSLPDGYDSVVEEEARNLTAAQRQLVALARAWLVEPDILILDEATSSLDVHLEAQVLEAVARQGRTAVMVTHRESVVAVADLVVVVDDGSIAEVGSLDELTGAGGAYDRLWALDPEVEPSAAGAFTVPDVVPDNVAASVPDGRVVRAPRTFDHWTPSLLRVRSLDVSYGHVQVLFGVDLDVHEGEIIALLGTNGAGKSTVLRAISGLAAPQAGSVIFDGTDITGMAPHQIAAARDQPGSRWPRSVPVADRRREPARRHLAAPAATKRT